MVVLRIVRAGYHHDGRIDGWPGEPRRRTMLLIMRCAVLAGLWLIASQASAQIYTCTAEDGTRVFSDEKCGPDAKVVPGITTKKRTDRGESRNRPERAVRPPEELDRLLRECNEGDMKACTAWTHGGGPNRLREQEERAGLACDGGSLEDCERRYCADGVTVECRRRVLGVAKITGETWYLRAQNPLAADGVAYQVRCLVEGARDIRDVTIECSGLPGPQRCAIRDTEQRFARLDQAAAKFCANP